MDTRADIAIVGGGIMGAALAYWLTRLEPTASVVVIERDPTYATASSALSAASIRQQFTTPVNIRIAQASIGFLRATGELLEVDGARPDIGLTEPGYLFLAGAAGWNRCAGHTRFRPNMVRRLRCWIRHNSPSVSPGWKQRISRPELSA